MDKRTVTIANAASLSNAATLFDSYDVRPRSLVGIVTPSTWTTADITFQSSVDGGVTWNNVITPGGIEARLLAIPPSSQVPIDPNDFRGVQMVRVRSGVAAAPVNQTGGDSLILVLGAP